MAESSGVKQKVQPHATFESTVRDLIGQNRLRFPSVLERVFRADYYEKYGAMTRIALGMAFALYSTFGLLDRFLAPEVYRTIWLIRFGIVDPIMVVVMVLSFFPFFRSIAQGVLSVATLLAGLGIVAMIIVLGNSQASLSYYAGLILVLMWLYTFPRIRFGYATLVGWLIVVAYELVAVVHQKMLVDPRTIGMFVNNNFFFIGASVMGTIVNYLMEVSARREFLQTQLIAEEQVLLERERNELRDRNTMIKRELEMARAVQQSLIPREFPSEYLHAIYRPMEEVGGDYFDIFRLDGGRKIGIFVSDVSGHGVPAALIAATIKAVLSESRRLQQSPGRLMMHLNDVISRQTEHYFVTAFYGIYDIEGKSFTWTNAGHPLPLLCHGGAVREVVAPKTHVPLGFLPNSELSEKGETYGESRIRLTAGSRLILFTDGLVEATPKGDRSTQFGDVIARTVVRLAALAPKEFLQELLKAVTEFCGGDDFADDICAICLDIK